ncbi:MAG TPA: tryptophan synthase subunit alpha [Cytophagales bacterium]|nr:tryptophan synthase subunit alpha [Cytophagales bacterium]
MNRITQLFDQKKNNLLSVFYTAGFPKLNDTIAIAKELQSAGADIIEIGIPFSDPVADGPVIQESNKVALDNGMNLKLLLQQVKEIRQEVTIPIILMGYLNPVMQYGLEKFCKDASEVGIDGLILPDLPMFEYENEYGKFFEANNLLNIFLVSPTTSEERIKKIDSVSSGFIYAVSASSTTGAKGNFTDEQIVYFKKLNSLNLKNPIFLGFGISNNETFSTASKYSNGAIVGSAFIKAISEKGSLMNKIKRFIHSLRSEL